MNMYVYAVSTQDDLPELVTESGEDSVSPRRLSPMVGVVCALHCICMCVFLYTFLFCII